jgi:hypothetical protein
VFTYTVKVPKADHERAKTALRQTCKDDEVSQQIICMSKHNLMHYMV